MRRGPVAVAVAIAVATVASLAAAAAGMGGSAGAAGAQSRPTPTITLKPDCIQDRPRAWQVNASGRMPYNDYQLDVVFDYGGSRPLRFTGPVDGNFNYSVQMSIPTRNYSGTSWTVAAYQTEPDGILPESFVRTIFRSPCTSTTTTGTTSSSTSSSTTSSSTTIPLTPAATLTVTPAIGPPGFVASAHGTGFPPGPVALTWSPGLGGASATADAAGTFTVAVLVMRKDIIGPRTLTAIGGVTTASAGFLVVPAPAQPRRFIARR